MAVSQANSRPNSGDNIEAMAEEMIKTLKDGASHGRLRAENSNGTVGTYHVQDGELIYESGPKRLTGNKARKYLGADIESDSMRLTLESHLPA